MVAPNSWPCLAEVGTRRAGVLGGEGPRTDPRRIRLDDPDRRDRAPSAASPVPAARRPGRSCWRSRTDRSRGPRRGRSPARPRREDRPAGLPRLEQDGWWCRRYGRSRSPMARVSSITVRTSMGQPARSRIAFQAMDVALEQVLVAIGLEQIGHPHAGAAELVAVGRTDARLVVPSACFPAQVSSAMVHSLVVGQHDVRAIGDEQAAIEARCRARARSSISSTSDPRGRRRRRCRSR